MHSPPRYSNVSNMSAHGPPSSSPASDALVHPYLYVDIDAKGKKLNCGVLGRSTSRRTGCEDKLWPAERDFHDRDVLIRAFPSSIGYSEGSCTVRSESQQCPDGAYGQSECIIAVVDGHKSEDDGVENDSGSEEEHRRGGQGNEGNHGQVCETGHDRRLGEEAEGEVLESTKGLQLSGDKSSCRVTKSSLTIRMPATSIECLQIRSKGTQLQCAEEKLRRFSEGQTEVVSAELEPSSSFGDVAESVDHINKGGGRGKEPQLAERASISHELFRERPDVVGSRGNERGGVQLGLSSSWGDNLRGSQEQLSFQGEDTVECITNVGEDDDFGFDVEEFRTPGHGQNQEETHHTESRSEFHARGDQCQGGEDRQGTPSATFESPRAQTEKTSRGGASSRLRSSENVLEEIHPLLDATSGRKISQRIEAGAGRVHVGKGQEKDARGEGHLRRSEASLVSEERRVRARLDVPAAGSGRGEQTEEVTKVVRPSRPSGGKDRHSKVNTAKGPRDRRVRLSVPTAVQFYDVQDRLGYDQPSKAVEWLIKKAKAAIDELGRLPARGNDGPSALSDISHASPYSADLAGPVSGSSSCPPNGSFPAALSSPFGDHIPNHMSYFIDSSVQQGMAFGNHQVHIRDVGGVSLSQAHFATGQGQLAGLSFPLGQTDLSRGNPGCAEGCKVGEFTGSPLARLESRVKARERARERVKEKCTGRDGGKVGGSGSSPSSMQSPPLHQTPIHSSFPVQNAIQSSLHNIPLQSPHPSPGPLQSSLSGVFHTTLSGIMQSSQQGTLQNLIMHNPSLQSPLTDQVQGSLQHPFQASLHSTLQNPRGQQQSHLQISTLEGSAEGALDMESVFTPGPCSSSFSDAASLSSSDFMSISSLPTSQSLPMSHLSAFGISPSCSMGGHFATGSIAVQIPPGFSPGPPSSAFRPRPGPISQSSPKDQQQQGLSRPPGQVILPSYSTGLASPAGSPSSKASAPLYYSTASSRMGSLQSISPSALESASFSSIRNVNYDYQRGLQMMSPARTSSSYQTSNSQLQMPARIHGLDHEDFDEELTSPPPSSPHVHP